MNKLGESKNSDSRQSVNNCFVCGSNNPIGLKVEFSIAQGLCVGYFTPEPQHAGYENVTHGGIIFSLLDDVMANWVWLQGEQCFTAKADVRYRSELPIGMKVRLEGHCLKRKGRLAQMEGKMILTDTEDIVAEANASFMIKSN